MVKRNLATIIFLVIVVVTATVPWFFSATAEESNAATTVSTKVSEKETETVSEAQAPISHSTEKATKTNHFFVEKPRYFANNKLDEITVVTTASIPEEIREEMVAEVTEVKTPVASPVDEVMENATSDTVLAFSIKEVSLISNMEIEGETYHGQMLTMTDDNFKVKVVGRSQAGIIKKDSFVYILFTENCTNESCSIAITSDGGETIAYSC